MIDPRSLELGILENTRTIKSSLEAGLMKSEAISQQIKENGKSLSSGLLNNQAILTQMKDVSASLSIAHIRSEKHESEVISMLQYLLGLHVRERGSQISVRVEAPSDREKQSASYSRLMQRASGWRLDAPWLGIQYSSVQVESSRGTDVSRSLLSKLPFLDYALLLRVSHWSSPLCRHVSLLPGSGVSVSRIVPGDSEIMIACREGNAAAVEGCFRHDGARTDDVSVKNMTLLLEAAHGGNSDVVRFLLGQHRASVNWTGGSRQTSPLQWAIQHRNIDVIRTLIDHGADLDHVSTLGWSPVFYCWPLPKRNEGSSIEIIKMLAEKSSLELNMVDCANWTVLQRAASFGTAEDVAALLALGADPYTAAPPLGWNALHHAVHASNSSTLAPLLEHCGQQCLQIRDRRGWSLLHVAAANGSREVLSILFERGVDPNILSFSRQSHMTASLYGRRVTAGDVAQAYDQHEAYGECLLVAGASASATWHQEVDEDIFWDAEEAVS